VVNVCLENISGLLGLNGHGRFRVSDPSMSPNVSNDAQFDFVRARGKRQEQGSPPKTIKVPAKVHPIVNAKFQNAFNMEQE